MKFTKPTGLCRTCGKPTRPAQSRQGEEELCAWICSRICEGRTVRQTILCNAIKWALARPNARWELVAFDAWLATEHAAWRLKTLATTGQTAAE